MANPYQINDIVFGDWIIKRKIGEGSFGRVFEIQREDFGHIYHAALKVITVPGNESEVQSLGSEGMTLQQVEEYFYSVVEDIVREFAIMYRLKGTANIVGYEDHKVIRHSEGIGWDVLIRMELLNPLLTYAYEHPFSRKDIIKLGMDMCQALELCQKYNIIHRDLKPENIFVSGNGDFKLGDFGIARTIEKTSSGLSKKGTYNYMAPEAYRGENYGFDVDLYSLGIVMYRMLNKNRLPFLPPAPKTITFQDREEALTRRISGESLPKPYYAEGRLWEILLKASAFLPENRFSSPGQMRKELEAILYAQEDAELIYPDGDELELHTNEYASNDYATEGKTESVFSDKAGKKEETGAKSTAEYADRTESIFHTGEEKEVENEYSDRTESIFGKSVAKGKKFKGLKSAPSKAKAGKGSKVKKIALIGVVAVVAIVFIAALSGQQKKQKVTQKQSDYETTMSRGMQLVETDPERALEIFSEALSTYPNETEPFIAYSYALYKAGKYDECITYIEDELSLGKQFDAPSQGRLSEILGAAYFEKQDYAAAASFFRLSTAGGDITESAMRDYAVSLAKLGDFSAADEIIERMKNEGANDIITDYVHAEVLYAQKEYEQAEPYFQDVIENSDDLTLVKNATRSLATLYRDCVALEKTGDSPIYTPAIKAVEWINKGMSNGRINSDSVLTEYLAMAYYDAHFEDDTLSEDYLIKSAENFEKLIQMGIKRPGIYENIFNVYYELPDYDKAGQAIDEYENAYPDYYVPHALRTLLFITIENEKGVFADGYDKAFREFEIAEGMIKASDDDSLYLQTESWIDSLKAAGWSYEDYKEGRN